VHSQVASLLDGIKLELIELKARSLLLGTCTSCPLLGSDLEACAIEIKNLKHQIDHSSCYSVLSAPCEMCDSLKCKLFHATKENTELKQEVPYLTSRLERTVVSEKMIENDLSQIEKSTTKSTYKLGVGFERCEDKGEKRAPKFIPTSNFHQEEETIKSTKTHYPSSPKPSFNPKREVRKETPKPRDEAFICMSCGRASHLNEFCFRHKRIEKMRFNYDRNSYCDEFIDFLPRSYSRAPSRFIHGPNHHSYGLVHERTTLCLDALVMTHALIVVIISRVGLVFLLEGLTLTLRPENWLVHIFPVVIHVPLDQMVKCKGL
jgi:uncharacterized protein YjeT (DUF2065 family)